MSKAHAIGVDIGGTNMSAAVVHIEDGLVVARETVPTLAAQGAEDGMARLIALINRAIGQADISEGEVEGIGIGCTGPVDSINGLVKNPYTLPTWDDLPIVAYLQGAFHLPVTLLNDAHVAALAEYHFGAGVGAHNMIYMTVSTGIGGCLILNGRLYRGQGLMAGEIGHQSIHFEGIPCYCGAKGCWEMYASGPAIARMAQERVTSQSLIWQFADEHKESITGAIVGQAAQQGDALAIEILEETGRYLGIGIANLLNIIAPDVIIMGGGVMQSQAILLPAIQKHLKQQEFLVDAEKTRLLPAALGLNAGIVGAAMSVRRVIENTL